MKTYEDFVNTLMENANISREESNILAHQALRYIEEGKKKKKKKNPDEMGAAPKTGHEMKDKDLGFEDPLKGYPEQERIY
jgi:hypothetical protein